MVDSSINSPTADDSRLSINVFLYFCFSILNLEAQVLEEKGFSVLTVLTFMLFKQCLMIYASTFNTLNFKQTPKFKFEQQ